MKKIEVFGTGCKKCVSTEESIRQMATKMDVPVDIQKVNDPVAIATRGIITTPAVMIDGKLVHKGGVPEDKDIAKWLSEV
ncbi:MAG: thioredoxin family protein [Myxococcales bacterium]|nr:MAG: thioredoxin family protein [Myxococcales bacterium]